ncbi:MAG TPA: GDSL-type esterase/lipase family protein, partial [Kiritimatiellia bacterium]
LCSCGSGPRIRPLADDDVVVAFGDSITAGHGAGAGESYPEVLAGLIGRDVVNEGVPGETTSEGLERLSDVLDEHQPALLILSEGGNDMLRKESDDVIIANLKAMIGLAREKGADILLVAEPRPALRLKTAGFYRDLARELGVPCECEAIAEILSSPGLKSDQIHPNALGYEKLAQAVAKAMDTAAGP